MVTLQRAVVIVVLLAVTGMCIFGFLASFEPPGFVVWRVGYALTGVACLAGIGWTLFSKPRAN